MFFPWWYSHCILLQFNSIQFSQCILNIYYVLSTVLAIGVQSYYKMVSSFKEPREKYW